MEPLQKEGLVHRICSGTLRVRISGKAYLFRKPTPQQQYVAAEVYQEHLEKFQFENMFSEQELLEYMVENDFWDEEKENFLQKLPKEIEEFKVQLYKANFKSNERKVIRECIKTARKKLMEVESERHAYDHLSRSGAALITKNRYLAGCSLYTLTGVPVFNDDLFWDDCSSLLDEVINRVSELRLSETEYRELARTDPWRSLWACRKAENTLFGIPVVSYSDEQKTLVSFSCFYDSVYESPDCPGEDVVDDDDMLDGWIIDQRRQREANAVKKSGEELIANEKIRNSEEIYLLADTKEDARKVVDLNDEHAKKIQKKRFKYLKEKGEVREIDMPDVAQRLRMEATAKLSRMGK